MTVKNHLDNRKKLLKEIEYRDLLDINSKKYRNVVKIWKGVSLTHTLVMTQICWKLIKDYGMEVYSEAIFGIPGKPRADIFGFNGDFAVIIEIGYSESEIKFNKKRDYYPKDIPIIFIDAKTFDINNFKI